MMELGPQNHNRDGLLGPNSIMVVCVCGPSGFRRVLFGFYMGLGLRFFFFLGGGRGGLSVSGFRCEGSISGLECSVLSYCKY